MENLQDLLTNVQACGRRVPHIGDVYNHFKGMKVIVENIAVHTEDGEVLVIYRHDNNVWARPLKMFLSKVDVEKYPNCKQTYRFERELPWNVKTTPLFNELIDILSSCKEFETYTRQELEDYVINCYYI